MGLDEQEKPIRQQLKSPRPNENLLDGDSAGRDASRSPADPIQSPSAMRLDGQSAGHDDTSIPSRDRIGQLNQRYACIPSRGLQLRTGLCCSIGRERTHASHIMWRPHLVRVDHFTISNAGPDPAYSAPPIDFATLEIDEAMRIAGQFGLQRKSMAPVQLYSIQVVRYTHVPSGPGTLLGVDFSCSASSWARGIKARTWQRWQVVFI